MELLRHTSEFRDHQPSSVVTIGVFDGVHRGHREIIRRCVDMARKAGLPAVVLTFERNPKEMVSGRRTCVLNAPSKKLQLIESLGVDFVITERFSRRFASRSPSDFCREVLAGDLGARVVCVGEDFRFGAHAAGDVATLEVEGGKFGFELEVVKLVSAGGVRVSSTLIRELIREGKVHEVEEALGRAYSLEGRVVHGHSRGKRLGFPTANLKLSRHFCLPPDGVYAGKAWMGGERYICAVNKGSNPTFGDRHSALEVFLLNFNGDIYGEKMEVEFHCRLRNEVAFPDEQGLIKQMEEDVRRVREFFAGR